MFKGFAIASAMFGAVVIYMYGDSLCYSKFKLCEREKAFSTVILVLGIVECLIGCTGCYCVTSSGHEVIKNMYNRFFLLFSLDNMFQFSLKLKYKVILMKVSCSFSVTK